MDYYYTTRLGNITFDQAVNRVTEALAKEGFGVATEMDMKATFKNKLNVDFYNYKILGACNPLFAYKALEAEDKIGTMLPCNFILQENVNGIIEISAVNPLASMQSVKNEFLKGIASEINEKVKNVIHSLE